MTYPTRASAERWLSIQEADLVRGTYRAPSRASQTVSDYVTAYIEARPIKTSSRTRYRENIALHLLPHPIAKKRLDAVTADDVRAWWATLNEATGPTAARHAYQLVKAAMRQAEDDDLILRNPCRLRMSNPRRERPTASLTEVLALADAMPPRYRMMVLVAAFYAPRKGELMALTRADVEGGGLSISKRFYAMTGGLDLDVPKTAAGRRRVTPIPALDAMLADHLATYVRPEPDALVFTTRNGTPVRNLTSQWTRARAQVGRPDLAWHDLRHVGATLLRMNGATDEEIQARLGHTHMDMTRLYLHSTSDHSRQISERLSDLLEAQGGRPRMDT
jgi:integrase